MINLCAVLLNKACKILTRLVQFFYPMPQNKELRDLAIREKVRIRKSTDADFNFIISSWLKTYKYSGPHVRKMLDRIYYEAYEPIVKDLIKRSDIYVACLREDPDVIVGYLALERSQDKDVIHFCLIKDLWQKMGVATYLAHAAQPKEITYFTHWTNPIESIVNKIPYLYQPFLISGALNETKVRNSAAG